jgi:hypothetical protein
MKVGSPAQNLLLGSIATGEEKKAISGRTELGDRAVEMENRGAGTSLLAALVPSVQPPGSGLALLVSHPEVATECIQLLLGLPSRSRI